MPRFESLPARPQLSDLFRRFPVGVKPLLEYHDILLRGPSPLSVGERELIAAFVSALNACRYCLGAHQMIAALHGVDARRLEALLQAPHGADVDSREAPLFAYLRKLTEAPARLTDADAAAVRDAGWSEEALFHAICVAALFNFMNRIVDGSGIVPDTAMAEAMRRRHEALRDVSDPYQTFGRQAGLIPGSDTPTN